MPDPRHPATLARLRRIRRAVETAIAKLSEMFAAQTTKARDLPGFVNRMARKLLADNFSLMAAKSDRPRKTRESGIDTNTKQMPPFADLFRFHTTSAKTNGIQMHH